MQKQRNKVQKVAVEPWEIGAELLDVLSRGLYTDAKDAIREYVQNGIDALASTIIVNVNGPAVMIRDDGTGMNKDSLRRARRFGISDKIAKHTVGYRGIGLYSAFGMCERLVIATRQAGMSELLQLEFDFGKMRDILEQDRDSEKRAEISLTGLLYEYTGFSQEEYDGDLQDHFTLVRLEGVIQAYRAQLTDASSLNTYLLNTIPTAFPKRGYGEIVNQLIQQHTGINPVDLVLRVGNEPEIKIDQPIAEDVGTPEYHILKDAQGTPLAFIWYCLSTEGERVASKTGMDEASGISGFLLRLKGFTLGDRTRLKPLWPPTGGRTLYHHYTGEVHILDNAEVYPNAARDDLEPSIAKQFLLRYLEDYFKILNGRADLARDIVKTQRRMKGIKSTLDELVNRHTNDNQDPFELYRASKNFLDVLQFTERDLLRLTRSRGRRKAVQPNEEQLTKINNLKSEIAEASQQISLIIKNTSRRTSTTSVSSRAASQAARQPSTPQATLLSEALKYIQAMQQESSNTSLTNVIESLSEAVKLQMVARAVAILDDLKASGISLNDGAEASRKKLRMLLGWSPVAPVSLEQALDEAGISLATSREQVLIRAIDRGLLSGLGGRGERYEAAIRSIIEGIVEEDTLH